MPEDSKSPPKNIAIIGGGISGMACSWKLRDHDCDVDIYEADGRLGGHANSVPFRGNGTSVNVDTGFIAMDEATYRKPLLDSCCSLYLLKPVNSSVQQVPRGARRRNNPNRYVIWGFNSRWIPRMGQLLT